MNNNKLTLVCESIVPHSQPTPTLNDILLTLYCIGEYDNDFNGCNGYVCLWDEAKDYESNLDYVCEKLKEDYKDKDMADISNVEDIVSDFFELWLGNYYSYYKDYKFEVLDTKGIPSFIVVSFTHS